MSAAGVVWRGQAELLAALLAFPQDMADVSRAIVVNAAKAAAAEIRASYPVVTGRLRKGVRVANRSRGLKARATVSNSVPYAVAFEYGKQARHTEAGASRGAMPAAKVFVPIALRHRRGALQDIGIKLEEQGATLRGEADA